MMLPASADFFSRFPRASAEAGNHFKKLFIERIFVMNNTPKSIPVTINNLVEPAPLVFRRKESASYNYPTIDNIPPGKYFSEIKCIEHSITRKKECAFDVCYEIVEYRKYARYHLGVDKTAPPTYKIKERIIRDSDREFEFTESLHSCYVLSDEAEASEFIGLTEIYNIGYNNGSDDAYGKIKKRFGFTETELLDWYSKTFLDDQD